ncbi:MAG: MFS transporter [Rhizobiales bacterium]|nr:MFS transporter [Hyphomicrobiales bacterium]
MTDLAAQRTDWGALWRSGDLARFCFISLGLIFHAGCENMITTIMPSMIREIGGVEYTGWSFAIYETGSIIAGAAAGRLSIYWTVRSNMIVAAIIFAIGCTITTLSPSMPVLLVGRVISGFGGGALISLSFVATQRYFPTRIWPQLMAILSVVWGISAFGGPLFGGLVDTLLTWRWAFGIFAAAALLFAAASRVVLHGEKPAAGSDAPGKFPWLALACLAAGVMAIAAAGIETRMPIAMALIAFGIAGVVLFFRLDARSTLSRLFPAATFNPRTTIGSGMIMVAALSVSTCSFGFYGPLLLAGLHDFTPLMTGLIIASESIAWSILSILVATASARFEPLIVTGGALMVTAGIAGFAITIPIGTIPGILFCALLQGGGFGILWPFASRRIIEAAADDERNLAASAFSTLQRMGYAIGAALTGIIANASGFSAGFTKEAAAGAAAMLFWPYLPLAIIGCVASFRLAAPRQPGIN